MPEPFYITTAISYPNGRPHVGHAYEAVAADAIARFHRLIGRDVRFQTGTDEHGLKMAQAARARGIEPRALADEMSAQFKRMADALHVSYDRFIRTTDPDHYRASEALWEAMEARGDLYLGRYEGWYSVRDEAFYAEEELVSVGDGARLSPQGTPVEWTVEESWFFRLSAYADRLLALYEANPDFIQPESRRNEVLSFVRGGLADLSVSRTSFDWGVPVPGSPGHVMYVWVDALTNYLTGVGYPQDPGSYGRFWPADLHLIGKDIVRFHAVYWPAFLLSAGLPVPKAVFGHGFLLHRGEKMSKSVGNVVDPFALVDLLGADRLRWFLLAEVPFGQDGSFSAEAIGETANAHLANAYGNSIQRVVAFIARRMEGRAPQLGMPGDEEGALADTMAAAATDYRAAMERHDLTRGAQACLSAIFACNQFMDRAAPWKAIKTDRARAEHDLATLILALARISIWLQPFVPEIAGAALDVLQVPPPLRDTLDADLEAWYRETMLSFPEPSPVVPKLELTGQPA